MTVYSILLSEIQFDAQGLAPLDFSRLSKCSTTPAPKKLTLSKLNGMRRPRIILLPPSRFSQESEKTRSSGPKDRISFAKSVLFEVQASRGDHAKTFDLPVLSLLQQNIYARKANYRLSNNR